MRSLSRPRIKKKIIVSVETEAQKMLALQVIGLLKAKGVEPYAGLSALVKCAVNSINTFINISKAHKGFVKTLCLGSIFLEDQIPLAWGR